MVPGKLNVTLYVKEITKKMLNINKRKSSLPSPIPRYQTLKEIKSHIIPDPYVTKLSVS